MLSNRPFYDEELDRIAKLPLIIDAIYGQAAASFRLRFAGRGGGWTSAANEWAGLAAEGAPAGLWCLCNGADRRLDSATPVVFAHDGYPQWPSYFTLLEPV